MLLRLSFMILVKSQIERGGVKSFDLVRGEFCT